jgi:hypothetical protein
MRLVVTENSTASNENCAPSSSSLSYEKKNLLATKLLHASLLSSPLSFVLKNSTSGITLDAVLKIGDLPKGSVLIAGSTMAVACLGQYDWRGDVDVYFLAKGAPHVQSVRILLSLTSSV